MIHWWLLAPGGGLDGRRGGQATRATVRGGPAANSLVAYISHAGGAARGLPRGVTL
jgi:hypothetical protein